MTHETALAVIPNEQQSMIESVLNFANKVKGTIIQSPAAFEGATEALQEVATLSRRLDDERKKLTRPLDDQKKDIMAAFKPAEDACKEARAAIEGERNRWESEQRRIREEAQRRENERAEKERQRLERLADKAHARGDGEKTAEYEQRAALVTAPVIPAAAVKVTGVSTRKVWKFELVDDGMDLPRKYLMPDLAKIRGVVEALKAETEIPGVRVYEEEITMVRSKA